MSLVIRLGSLGCAEGVGLFFRVLELQVQGHQGIEISLKDLESSLRLL